VQVLASGQAGLFAIQTGTGFTVEYLDSGKRTSADARDIRYHFAGCTDVTTLTVKNEVEARSLTELAWPADRAVRLFIILLDPNEPPADLVEVGEALDELLALPGVEERVEYQLFSAPLPQPIEVKAVLGSLAGAHLSTALLTRFLNLQSIIGRVRVAFDTIEDALFDEASPRERFFEQAIDRGSVRALVNAAASSGGIDKALFKLYSDLKDLEGYRAIVEQWTRSFERSHYELEPIYEPHEARSFARPQGAAGRQAFQRAIQQQVAIIDKVRAGEFDTARRYAQQLVTAQAQTSEREHIAKSLTKLSQEAKHLEVIDLAMEWARQAIEIKGDDATAHAHLADILMRMGRYGEAHRSLDLAQSFGEAGFAASGRARILRYQGQFLEALNAYREAYERNRNDGERTQFNLAGIAECLRDMERYEDALVAYDEAIAEFPLAQALHTGRAATLVDMGRFDEALVGYQTALKLDGNNVVPRNGIAALYLRAGQLERAEALYREIIPDFPFDPHARGGLVATLRQLERFDEAVIEAKIAAQRSPQSADIAWILADAQIDAEDFEGARSTLQEAIAHSPHVAGLRTGLARIEKAKGHYATALALYDEAARAFPSNNWIQLRRADMLRRLGNIDEAIRVYENAYREHPRSWFLKNAIASIYIHKRLFAEADELLSVDNPRTTDEWRNFALRGMLEGAAGNNEEARKRFDWGIEHCPFPRERKMLRAALSRLQLAEGRPDLAAETARECGGDVTELVKFHAFASCDDKGPARDLYDRLLRTFLPEPYFELREEIARQFNVVNLPARRDAAWVLEREQEALILEAA